MPISVIRFNSYIQRFHVRGVVLCCCNKIFWIVWILSFIAPSKLFFTTDALLVLSGLSFIFPDAMAVVLSSIVAIKYFESPELWIELVVFWPVLQSSLSYFAWSSSCLSSVFSCAVSISVPPLPSVSIWEVRGVPRSMSTFLCLPRLCLLQLLWKVSGHCS